MRERNGLVIAALVGAFATAAFSVGNVILGAPDWSQSDVTIGRGSTVWFFKVTLPRPGDYHAYLLLNSPAFYGREDVSYDAKIRAVAR